MLRISLQRFAQFATGRIRRGGHDSVVYGMASTDFAPSALECDASSHRFIASDARLSGNQWIIQN
jgi:hypothetical protein